MTDHPQPFRLTKIVCTLGPSSTTEEQLKALAEAGMNVARINLSHGSREEHAAAIRRVQALNEQGFCVAGLIDTRGAEIRTGVVIQPIPVTIGQEIVFSSNPQHQDAQGRTVIEVNYDGFANDVRETDTIIVDNGTISCAIVSIEPDGSVVARAKDGGSIGSRRHINLPGADIDLPSITRKDWDDIAFGAEQGVDYVALSFIRNAEEITEVRSLLKKKNSDMKIITKIETKRAAEENLAEIITVSDGIMVARGDLGTDIPIEELPAIQDEIVVRCRDAGKPVIVATHMLESMSMYPLPTRAEVTDVAHAGTTGTDATMLSGETASGKHPVKCVETMDRILRATEGHIARLQEQPEGAVHNEREARAQAAVTLAHSTKADAIVVITKSGRTAREVAKFRPVIPVIGCAATPSVRQKLALVYGIFPVLASFTDDTEATIETGVTTAKKAGFLTTGMRVVLISDAPAKHHNVSTIQVREIS
ncbi:MAG: pyruvate kinase [Candidatus Peribacteraceae bacterium]|jgi:pyruvate kinase|nr:pyruvate kinase [Candidatus Peribacteraceae bacterium]